MKIIDLSVPIEEGPSDPIPLKIDYKNHRDGAEFLSRFFGADATDMPMGGAAEVVVMSSHAGTHVDAPWHYAPTSEGRSARTIDEMPLEWFFSDALALDMRHKPNGSAISIEDIVQRLERI